jgi:hypothetical protein
MHVESDFAIFGSLSIHLLQLLSSRLPVAEISEGITNAEVVIVFNFSNVDSLQLREQIEIIEDLLIRGYFDVFLLFEEDAESTSLGLGFGCDSLPACHNLLGLSDWSLHHEGGVMGGRYVGKIGLLGPFHQLFLCLLDCIFLAGGELSMHCFNIESAVLSLGPISFLLLEFLLEAVAELEVVDFVAIGIVSVEQLVEIIEKLPFKLFLLAIERFAFGVVAMGIALQ